MGEREQHGHFSSTSTTAPGNIDEWIERRIGTGEIVDEFCLAVDSLVVAIVETIAEAAGVDEHELPPLDDAVDLEALTRVLQAQRSSEVTFVYVDHVVHITGNGQLLVRPVDEPAADR